MEECKSEGCKSQAILGVSFCWEHIDDEREYKDLILRLAKGENADLAKANLQSVDLGGDDLTGANLKGANLRGAILEGTYLVGAYLERADLREANLWGANLWGVSLGGAKLGDANLTGADLREADLRGVDLRQANLRETDLRGADLRGADLAGANLWAANLREADLREANLEKANLTDVDLRNTNLNEADLTGAKLTGARVWGMSKAGCKTENIKAEYLNFDKEGKDSGIVHLKREQAEEFFSSQPTIEILLQNKLPPYAIRVLLNLIDKINQRNPDWGVELIGFNSSDFLSKLAFGAGRDEILEMVADWILPIFHEQYQKRLLEYFPNRKAAEERALILRELEDIKRRIPNTVIQLTMFRVTGETVNMPLEVERMRDIRIFGNVGKMIQVEGDYYEVSAPDGREDLLRALIDQLDSPEIDKKMEQAETELRGLSKQQLQFLEKEFKQIAQKVFREKREQPGFADKVKQFSKRSAQSTFSGVLAKAIWYAIKTFFLGDQ